MQTRTLLGLGFATLVTAVTLLAPGRSTAAQTDAFPAVIALPNGFRPEGIVIGRGPTIYAGSIDTGAIYAANLRTGQGAILVPPQAGRSAIGLGFDARTNFLYVAGGATGDAYVYHGSTGATIAVVPLTSSAMTFVNDVEVTQEAAYFTDSRRPVLYRLPLLAGGQLPSMPVVEEIPLGGAFVFDPDMLNANGIVATPDGRALIIVHSTLGTLYRVDPLTGQATQIDLGDEAVPNGDGLLLVGHTLYVVQNRLNVVAVVELDPSLTSGQVVRRFGSPLFDVPTTIARSGTALYLVNARFSTPPTPQTPYTIVRVDTHP
jgi:sugar lactone lactonase YvrE